MFNIMFKGLIAIVACIIIGMVMSIGLNLMSQPDDIVVFAGVILTFASFCSFIILLTLLTGKL